MVEDESIVALDIQNLLRNLGYDVVAIVSSGEEAVTSAAEMTPDLVLMDIRLKGALDGVEAAEQIRSRLDIPIIYLTAYADEATLQRAKVTEPFGYLVKPFEEKELQIAIEMALYKHQMERRLRESERWLATVLDSVGDAVVATDPQGNIIYVNRAFEQITGYRSDEVIGHNPNLLKSGEQDATFYAALWGTITSGQVWRGRFINKKKDGTRYTADTIITPVRDESGNIVNYIGLQRDVTRDLQREEQYRQAQKMEAIGQLTAGIAHYFNNSLTVINGFAELIKLRVPPDDPLRDLASGILRSGQRAADLVSQLLAFSRKQTIQPQVLNLNNLIARMDDLLLPLIGEHIQVEKDLASDLWLVRIDPTQIEQVVLNLAVNARDAMPRGGTLTIQTANVVLDDAYVAQRPQVQPGEYVLLVVSDTGTGMSDEVKAHLFEPFFTTKEVGQGTGLGLAAVHGIVSQNGGHISVYSEEGHGTSFRIYLPCVRKSLASVSSMEAAAPLPSGDETILVVEDNEFVRELVRRALEGHGYTLLEAQDGPAALQLAARHSGPIHLLLTDVVMPGISGGDLARELAGARPDLKILFMSGYAEEAITHHGLLAPGTEFLQKPFSASVLLRKVREVLDRG
ncbi:MAG: hypothetical protein Kow0063_39000 [Anaerolineae bacterium]